MDQASKGNQKLIAIIGLIVIVAAIAVGIAATSGKKKSAATATTAPAMQNMSTSTSTAASGTYKDGTYTASANYDNPGGNSKLGVSITLANGAVTATTVTPEATDPTSHQYQEMFASGISGAIVGKQLSTVQVSRVSGSSLTSQGYNDALQQIKTQASS